MVFKISNNETTIVYFVTDLLPICYAYGDFVARMIFDKIETVAQF